MADVKRIACARVDRAAIAKLGPAHRDRTDPGQDLALRTVTMPHQAPPSIFGTKMIMRAQHVCDFRSTAWAKS